MLADTEVRERVARLDAALLQVEALPEGQARETALGAVQGLLELYGEGLARLIEQLPEETARAVAGDELVGHLLLVHGLHPVALDTRVQQALAAVRPTLGAHGGDVELLGIEDGVAHLRLQGTCNGCSSSETTLKQLIERALEEAAPDLDGIATETGPASSFVALECLVPQR